jgi:hypothetical protein
MRFIGDVHGKFDQYLKLIESVPESIQVGDFGAGFKPIPYIGINHRWIRGNHDNPEISKGHPNWIPDGHYENGMFFTGGALSVDAHSRTEGVDWWRDEELSYDECFSFMDKYESIHPEIMVTHDLPQTVAMQIFGNHKSSIRSRTRNFLDSLFFSHKPKLWICGHWHVREDVTIDGTRFIVLGELDHIDI